MGGVDVLINNAGYAYRAEIGAMTCEDAAMFDTNVFGHGGHHQPLVPRMKERKDGDIINIASTSGMKGNATGTPYAASKWAVRGISRCGRPSCAARHSRHLCLSVRVQTGFDGKTAATTRTSSTAQDIAATIMARPRHAAPRVVA
jgi:NADP-dependent 3-hydroxy acid dehydrogenase YdfG